MMRRIFAPKVEEMKKAGENCIRRGLHNLYLSPDKIRMITKDNEIDGGMWRE
jgi:hypothetical protein